MTNNWYPDRSNFRSHEEWNAHVQTLNIVYDQQAKLEQAVSDIKKIAQQPTAVAQPAGGPINTQIGGFALVPGQPSANDTIRYDAASGQFKFGA